MASPSLPEEAIPALGASRKTKRQERKRRRRRRLLTWAVGISAAFALAAGAVVAVAFFTPWGRRERLLLAETILTTRHYYLAHYLTTADEYQALVKQLDTPSVATGVPSYVHVTPATDSAVEVHPVSGDGWNGYVMLVHDPKLVRLVPARVHNGMGEYITDMAARTGAIAGTNASGFEDPKGGGWGGEAVGLVMVDGRVLHPPRMSASWTTVGFTRAGIMVMGNYSVPQLLAMGVRDAMQFHPELVVNGKPMITYGDGGWGYDPRTAIGQTRDGTVIFIVINGRFHGGSGMGASQRQVMDLMLQYGAVNACALDGGSSSVLYDHGQILNSPSTIDPSGQRHLPDAWLVFPTVQAANHM